MDVRVMSGWRIGVGWIERGGSGVLCGLMRELLGLEMERLDGKYRGLNISVHVLVALFSRKS